MKSRMQIRAKKNKLILLTNKNALSFGSAFSIIYKV